jgi:hypothetical protein
VPATERPKSLVMEAFGVVVIVVSVTAAVIALVAYMRANRLYEQIGRTGQMWLDARDRATTEEWEAIEEEVRQALDTVSREREARGEPPLQRVGAGR